jgi:hypothetical protein
VRTRVRIGVKDKVKVRFKIKVFFLLCDDIYTLYSKGIKNLQTCTNIVRYRWDFVYLGLGLALRLG